MRFIVGGYLFLIFAMAPSVAGQNRFELDFGGLAGVPFTVPLESRLTGAASIFSSQAFSRPPASGGLMFAVVVHDRLFIQLDTLYKRMRFNNSYFNGVSYSSSSTIVSSWEFPLIADYAFLQGPIRPFGGGGTLLGEKLSGSFISQLPAYVINGGLEWRMSRLVIRPELRYTRWAPVSQSTGEARRQNQFEYLVGFSFRGLKH